MPVRVSFVILMDTSRSMKQSFGSSTKFQAVREEILKFVKGRPDAAIALRFTSGGFCGEDYEEPTITFDRDNAPEIKPRLATSDRRPEAHIAPPTNENERELEKAVEETPQRLTDSNVVTDADQGRKRLVRQ